MASDEHHMGILTALLNHLTLPPRLPSCEDNDPSQIAKLFNQRLLAAARDLRDHCDDELLGALNKTCRALSATENVHRSGFVDQRALVHACQLLEDGDFLILHIIEQNAGLILRKQTSKVTFDVFEASAQSASVLEATAALQWDFPGSAVSVPIETFQESGFLENLARFLDQASHESIQQSSASVFKSGNTITEHRDTSDPALISCLVMALLEVNGTHEPAHIIRKRVRDDVCFEAKGNPWRRAAFWLVLRVAVQQSLHKMLGDYIGRQLYKILIVNVLQIFCGHLISANDFPVEGLALVRTKLGYRLSKLTAHISGSTSSIAAAIKRLFSYVEESCEPVMNNLNGLINSKWETFKMRNRRPITALPDRAAPEDMFMSMSHSFDYLMRVMTSQDLIHSSQFLVQGSRNAIKSPCSSIMAKYVNLKNQEMHLHRLAVEPSGTSCEEYCNAIFSYQNLVGDAYNGYVLGNSIMLLTIMELWCALDRVVVGEFPLLKDHPLPFPQDLLAVLQTSTRKDMLRLHEVEKYLDLRLQNSTKHLPSIFSDPSSTCLAARFYDESSELQEMHQEIVEQSQVDAEAKKEELKDLTDQYNETLQQEANSTCMLVPDPEYIGLKIHNEQACTKCFLKRKLRRFWIEVFEHPLPPDESQQKAICFELCCPPSFAVYRDVTWTLMRKLGSKQPAKEAAPSARLFNYDTLAQHAQTQESAFTLASKTKPIMNSHYKRKRLPAKPRDVVVACSLTMAYFDTSLEVWASNHNAPPSFASLCTPSLPISSSLQALQLDSDFAVDKAGPTPNTVVASQTKCPPSSNISEYLAFQELYTGAALKWVQLLRELGCSNINFSAAATTVIVSRVVLQAGPKAGSDLLRQGHWVLNDAAFCSQLMDQIAIRTTAIASNWRESQCVESMLTILLRMLALTENKDIILRGFELLASIRVLALRWIRDLQKEIHSAKDAATFEQRRKDVLWACLLARRTLYVSTSHESIVIDEHLAQVWVESSVILMQNTEDSFSSMPTSVRHAFIRDWRALADFKRDLRRSLLRHPQILGKGINNVLQRLEEDVSHEFQGWQQVDDEWFTSMTIAQAGQNAQQVDYNYMKGILLIDGQPLGKLPDEHRETIVVKDLFGDQPLLTYPSNMFGMLYMMAMPVEKHAVHFGRRGNLQIMRTTHLPSGATYEIVPMNVFGQRSASDLPGPLIDGCMHWLNLHNANLEVRPRSDVWKYKEHNWTLDLNSRRMWRRQHVLINPASQLYKRVTSIFDDFEPPDRMLLYQPVEVQKSLTLQLTGLDLMFFVNRNGLLQSRELRAEVDPNQDAGTWYGLRSKLVLRNYTTRSQRSIIIPLGTPLIRRQGMHVSISIAPSGAYARFTIDNLLQRLDCTAEPLLIYLRAQYHALTSFVLADPLTGHTGTQEALKYLRAANAQPWSPLSDPQRKILATIANITPRREFYPPGRKSMQRVTWDENLTVTIQNDELRSLAQVVVNRSDTLDMFHNPKRSTTKTNIDPYYALTRRAVSRHGMHQQHSSVVGSQDHWPDLIYSSRDGIASGARRTGVIEVTSYLKAWSSSLVLPSALVLKVQTWEALRGFVATYEMQSMGEALNTNFAQDFAPIANLCRKASKESRYELMFLFALLSYGEQTDMDVIRSLVAFATIDSVKTISPPTWSDYSDFKIDERPTSVWLKQELQPSRIPFKGDDRLRNDAGLTPKQVSRLQAEQKEHDAESAKQLAHFADHLLMTVWPEPSLDESHLPEVPLISGSKALDLIRMDWQRMAQNHQLAVFLNQIQAVFDVHRRIEPPHVPVHFAASAPLQDHDDLEQVVPSLLTLVRLSKCNLDHLKAFRVPDDKLVDGQDNEMKPEYPDQNKSSGRSVVSDELREIIDQFTRSKNATRCQYGHDLSGSLQAFLQISSQPSVYSHDVSLSKVQAEMQKGHNVVKTFEAAFAEMLLSDTRSFWLSKAGLWPRISPMALLGLLVASQGIMLTSGHREALIRYGITLTALQKLGRLEHAIRSQQSQVIQSELSNKGHTNWEPANMPEWLVLEIETNVLIRDKQVEVARATIDPGSKSNSVLQMNMGEGKTSCIIPMVVAALANSESIVRVIVPKALLPQMAQILQRTLGGILSRPTTHIPFSRRTPTTGEYAMAFRELHELTRDRAGVIVALPEHIMSFKLSGLQRLADRRVEEARNMVSVQTLLDTACRDVLDESDFTLSARTQLIYPSGSQKTVDGHPDRWTTVETMLHMVRGLLWNVRQRFPNSLEIDQRNDTCFPTVYFLHRRAEDLLVEYLVQSLSSGYGGIVNTAELNPELAGNVKRFISQPKISTRRLDSLRAYFPRLSRTTEWKNLLLLRGLLVHRILILALKKRWNVQYGLHPHRDPISVPYHAKGVPSETAEWGHPDVAILLTCLSFYYAGLSIAQLRQSLEHVLKSDDRGAEYERWLSGSTSVPGSLRDCNAINLDDDVQVVELWQSFRYSTIVIDHFLNNFVFPLHAKQFEQKLQASGWDIPLKEIVSKDIGLLDDGEPPHAKRLRTASHHTVLTTGFSGTNDNRVMLPLTITQNDLPALRGTNAEVLTYLLEPRNRGYVVAADNGRRLPELGLLRLFFRQNIRVFIDAGAQILESDNRSLVQEWLKVDYQRPAAIYFDQNDKAMVLHRKGNVTPLLGSPFVDDLENCLVYLDEAHTRGTDLKLPAKAIGALTLGPGQTKDHTVQAAMRLRQLATTQAVVFFAPPEVHQSIMDLRPKRAGVLPDSKDVIAWLLEQTCRGIEQLQPLYYSQGINFCNRSQALVSNPDMLSDKTQCGNFLRLVKQQEDHSLTQLYMPREIAKQGNCIIKYTAPNLIKYNSKLQRVRQSFEDHGEAVQAVALQEVEQEREVAVEAETVRAIDKPPQRRPLPHLAIDHTLVQICTDGHVRWKHFTCSPAFTYLRATDTGNEHAVHDTTNNPRLFVSQDFAKTVDLPTGCRDDAYARTVNWVLWSTADQIAIVISPHEAEHLTSILRKAKDPKTHLLVYAAPVTRRMLQFDDLNYYAIPNLPEGWRAPRWLRRDLGILAGRLYFKFEDYADLCGYLGVKPKIAGAPMSMDGVADGNERAGQLKTEKPLQFLQQWTSVRRKGQDFAHTPLGFIVQSKELDPTHPFFVKD